MHGQLGKAGQARGWQDCLPRWLSERGLTISDRFSQSLVLLIVSAVAMTAFLYIVNRASGLDQDSNLWGGGTSNWGGECGDREARD